MNCKKEVSFEECLQLLGASPEEHKFVGLLLLSKLANSEKSANTSQDDSIKDPEFPTKNTNDTQVKLGAAQLPRLSEQQVAQAFRLVRADFLHRLLIVKGSKQNSSENDNCQPQKNQLLQRQVGLDILSMFLRVLPLHTEGTKMEQLIPTLFEIINQNLPEGVNDLHQRDSSSDDLQNALECVTRLLGGLGTKGRSYVMSDELWKSLGVIFSAPEEQVSVGLFEVCLDLQICIFEVLGEEESFPRHLSSFALNNMKQLCRVMFTSQNKRKFLIVDHLALLLPRMKQRDLLLSTALVQDNKTGFKDQSADWLSDIRQGLFTILCNKISPQIRDSVLVLVFVLFEQFGDSWLQNAHWDKTPAFIELTIRTVAVEVRVSLEYAVHSKDLGPVETQLSVYFGLIEHFLVSLATSESVEGHYILQVQVERLLRIQEVLAQLFSLVTKFLQAQLSGKEAVLVPDSIVHCSLRALACWLAEDDLSTSSEEICRFFTQLFESKKFLQSDQILAWVLPRLLKQEKFSPKKVFPQTFKTKEDEKQSKNENNQNENENENETKNENNNENESKNENNQNESKNENNQNENEKETKNENNQNESKNENNQNEKQNQSANQEKKTQVMVVKPQSQLTVEDCPSREGLRLDARNLLVFESKSASNRLLVFAKDHFSDQPDTAFAILDAFLPPPLHLFQLVLETLGPFFNGPKKSNFDQQSSKETCSMSVVSPKPFSLLCLMIAVICAESEEMSDSVREKWARNASQFFQLPRAQLPSENVWLEGLEIFIDLFNKYPKLTKVVAPNKVEELHQRLQSLSFAKHQEEIEILNDFLSFFDQN